MLLMRHVVLVHTCDEVTEPDRSQRNEGKVERVHIVPSLDGRKQSCRNGQENDKSRNQIKTNVEDDAQTGTTSYCRTFFRFPNQLNTHKK